MWLVGRRLFHEVEVHSVLMLWLELPRIGILEVWRQSAAALFRIGDLVKLEIIQIIRIVDRMTSKIQGLAALSR